MSEEIWILVTVITFLTGLGSLWIPLIGFAGLFLGLIYIPYIDASNVMLVAIYVMSLVISALFIIVGITQGRKS